jgi:hypothetical protein
MLRLQRAFSASELNIRNPKRHTRNKQI